MAELRELERKLESLAALREVVKAMRNLAAVYVRRAEAALEAIRPYSRTVETALATVLDRVGGARTAPETPGKCLAVVFAGDQGLCGTYNDRVVREAVRFAAQAGPRVSFAAVGRRARDLLALRGITPVLSAPGPASLEGIRSDVPELAADLFETYVASGAAEMVFVYNEYEGLGRFREQSRPVLPPRREQVATDGTARFSYEPLLGSDPARLLGKLAEEYFFIELYRALLESHSSENGARLLAMTAASGNIDERLAEVTREFQSVRQNSITAELLDVVAGAEALAV